MKERTTPDSRNTPSTTNLEEEEIVDAPGNDGNASMPEQVKRPNPCMMTTFLIVVSITAHGIISDNYSNVIHYSGHSETAIEHASNRHCHLPDTRHCGRSLRTRPHDSKSPSSCTLMAISGHCGGSGRAQTAFSSPYKPDNGACVDAVGSGTASQAGRSRVRFPMVSLEFFIDITLPAALWPWG